MPDASLTNIWAFSLRVAIVVATMAVLLRIVLPATPRLRLACWRSLLAFCLVLALVPGALLGTGLGPASGHVAADVTAIVLAQTPASGPLTGWLALALVLGGVSRVVWLAAGLLRLRRLRGESQTVSLTEEARTLVEALAPRAAIRSHQAVEHPVAFGASRPVVLLPAAFVSLDPDQQRTVLCHELLHVKRRDWSWTLVEEGVRAALWFHPAIWWLLAELQRAREETVDAQTVAITGLRRAYMTALLAFGDEPPLSAAAALGRRRHLARRIALISKEVVMSRTRLVLTSLAVGALVGGAGLATLAALPLQTTSPQPSLSLLPQAPSATVQPRITHEVKPKYPEEALEHSLGATVVVKVLIDTSGRVTHANAVGWSLKTEGPVETTFDSMDPWKPFTESAEAAARQWTFEPLPSPAEVMIEMNFTTKRSPPDAGIQGGVPGGVAGGVRGGIGQGIDAGAGGVVSGAVRVGGNIESPTRIVHVRPVYPQEAQDASVQGVVILEVRIGTDGSVEDVVVLKSIPLLDQAAIDAVRQWRYTPTLINGKAVPVIMMVTVNFTLDR